MKSSLEPKATILVVEDDENVRYMVALSLKFGGYSVIEAGTAEQAQRLWIAQHRSVHIVVTDFTLPDKTGAELARELRATSPAIPIIFVSGHEERLVADSISSMPNVQVLAKPYTSEKMAAAIEIALRSQAGAFPNNAPQQN